MNFIDTLIDFQYWGYIALVLILITIFLYGVFYRKYPEKAKLLNHQPIVYWSDKTYKYIFTITHVLLLSFFAISIYSKYPPSFIKIFFFLNIIFFSLPELITYFKYKDDLDFRKKIIYRTRFEITGGENTGNITIPYFKEEYLTKEFILMRNLRPKILLVWAIVIFIYISVR
jgi:hypothetical protein